MSAIVSVRAFLFGNRHILIKIIKNNIGRYCREGTCTKSSRRRSTVRLVSGLGAANCRYCPMYVDSTLYLALSPQLAVLLRCLINQILKLVHTHAISNGLHFVDTLCEQVRAHVDDALFWEMD